MRDSENHGFVNSGVSLFGKDDFNIVERNSFVTRDIRLSTAALAVMFISSESTGMDGQYHGESEEVEGLWGTDFIQTVQIYFLVNEIFRFQYNNLVYRVSRPEKPIVDDDIKELVRNWIFYVLQINSVHNDPTDPVKWTIRFSDDDPWEVVEVSDFGGKQNQVGFYLEIPVHFELEVEKPGEP